MGGIDYVYIFISSKESENRMYNTAERNSEIFKLYSDGWTYQAIGEEFDLSKERIRQICVREARKQKLDELQDASVISTTDAFLRACIKAVEKLDLNTMLAPKTYNCLNRAKVLYNLTPDIGLASYSDEQLLAIRGFGPKLLEIAREADYIFRDDCRDRKNAMVSFRSVSELLDILKRADPRANVYFSPTVSGRGEVRLSMVDVNQNYKVTFGSLG